MNFSWEAPMNTRVRVFLHGFVFILGLALIVAGIDGAQHGAVVIGIIVAGVSVQQFLKTKKATKDDRLGHAP